MTPPEIKARGCGCLFTALGWISTALLMTVAVTWALRSSEVETTWAQADGTVVDLVPSDDGNTYAPVVEFVASDGVVRRFEHNVFSTSARDGESVDVRYDPADPDRAVIHSTAGFWLGPIAFGTAGVTALLATIVLSLAIRRRTRSAVRTASDVQEGVTHDGRRAAEYRRVETRINGDGTFHWQIVAKGEDGLEYRSDWLDEDPQLDLMANSYGVELELRGHEWIVIQT
jgi:hypothetical protein